MRLVKIGENSLQYSLQDTTRHALFLVTSRVEKFVGKTAVDTIAVRLGAIMSAVMVFVGTRRGWSTRTFAIINVGLGARRGSGSFSSSARSTAAARPSTKRS